MITKKVTLNTWEINEVVVYANRGEVDSRYIEVSFKDSEANTVSLSERNVVFYAKKPDGNVIFNNCTVDGVNNTAILNLTSQTLSVPGLLECEFQIFDGTNVLLKVNGLKIFVSEDENFSGALESTSEANALISAINRSEELLNNIGSLDSLNTIDKSTITGAINEINSKIIPISQGGTGGITATEARRNLEVTKGTVLYSNDSGSGGTITLSEDSGNFDYIDIFFQADGAFFSCQRTYDPNNRKTEVFANVAYKASSLIMIFAGLVSFVGKSVIWDTDGDAFFSVNKSLSHNFNLVRCLYIYKVIGYSY